MRSRSRERQSEKALSGDKGAVSRGTREKCPLERKKRKIRAEDVGVRAYRKKLTGAFF